MADAKIPLAFLSRTWRTAPIVVAVFAFAGSACNCGKNSGGDLQKSDGIPKTLARLNFGNVQVGTTVTLALPLDDVGSVPLDVTSQVIQGAAFAEPTLFPSSILQSSNAEATLSFSPTQSGPATGTLTIGDDGSPTQVVVQLLGNGVDLALSVTPPSLTFGAVPIGESPSPSQTVTFQNNNTAAVYVTINDSSTAPEYQLSDSAGALITSSPVQIPAGGSYLVNVSFTPDQVAIFDSSFSYTPCADATTATCLSAQSIQLSGQGVTGTISFTPNPISFSGIPSGQSAEQTVTATNVGGASATLSCLYLQSVGASSCQQPSSAFSFSGLSTSLPATLAPGASLTFVLTYTATSPSASDALGGTYTAQDNPASQTATDDIEAGQQAAPCQISITPASVTFVSAAVGAPQTQEATLTNSGTSDCNVSGVAIDPTSDPSYALASGQATSFTIATGASATIGVTFDLNNTNSPSTRRGLLDFQSNDTSHSNVQIPMLASLVSPYAGGGAWPRWHHDNIQSGLSPNDTSSLAGVVAWTANVSVPAANSRGGSVNDYLNSPVVGADGSIYQVGMNGTLYAFYPDGGSQWSTFLEGPVVDPHPSTPIIASDSSLYVAFGETSSGGNGGGLTNAFYHVSPSGQILSSIPPVSGGDGFDLPPMLTNSGLLLGGDDRNGAFAFTISGGAFTLSDTYSPQNRLSQADQMSAVVGPDNSTYWCQGGVCVGLTPPPAFAPITAWPAGGLNGVGGNSSQSTSSDLALDVAFTGNLMVLFGDWGSSSWNNAQQLASINPSNGSVVWSVTLPAPATSQDELNYPRTGDATVGNSCPAIGLDGTVYVGNFDGLHAFNGSSGQEKSGFPFPTSSDVLTAPAIGGDGTIFVGTADGSFYAVNPDGSLRFKLTAGGRIAGSPAIGPNGNVYFVADDGNLYAVQ